MNRPPNIIFILIDDMGWMDLSCQGSAFYETPNIDRLARQGMRFTSAYASCPVCSPTRASIMTGQYPARVGITNYIPGRETGRVLDVPYLHYLPRTHKTVAAALREGGYRTWHVGKWHLGNRPYWPQHHGFDVNIGGWEGGGPRAYFSPYGNPMLPDGPEGEYLTDRLTDEAIRLVETAGDRPFFLNLCHYAVHIPIQVPPRDVEKYREKARAMGLDRENPFEEGEYFPCDHKKSQRVVRRLFQSDPAYAAMIENLDRNIGRLLAAVEAAGLARDTMVIFTSDNGGLATAEGSPTCNAPLAEGKGWMYEGGTREPLLWMWPGVIPPASTCDVPVTSTDFYPTFLEAAGLPLLPQQHCDGVSLMPLLRGAGRLDRRAIFWHYPHYGNQGGTPACAVRSGNWKLIEFFEDSRVELYDLQSDVSEEHNLAAQCPDVASDLRGLLHQWLKDVRAKIPQPNPAFSR